MKKIEDSDIENIRVMLDAGLSTERICKITSVSASTVSRIRGGYYDTNKKENGDSSASLELFDKLSDVEACLNKNGAYVGEAVYLAVDKLKDIQEQMEKLLSYVSYLAKQESLRQEREADRKEQKMIGLKKWSEILLRVRRTGDQTTYAYLKDSTARWDGETLMIDCKQPDRDYLSRNKSVVERIKNQAQLVLGVPVNLKW